MPPWAGTIWAAWHRLQYDRQYGAMGGEAPLGFGSIDRYAVRYGIDGDAFELLHALVTAMDAEYLDWSGEKRKAEAKSNGT